jgi:hypothetical protein
VTLQWLWRCLTVFRRLQWHSIFLHYLKFVNYLHNNICVFCKILIWLIKVVKYPVICSSAVEVSILVGCGTAWLGACWSQTLGTIHPVMCNIPEEGQLQSWSYHGYHLRKFSVSLLYFLWPVDDILYSYELFHMIYHWHTFILLQRMWCSLLFSDHLCVSTSDGG